MVTRGTVPPKFVRRPIILGLVVTVASLGVFAGCLKGDSEPRRHPDQVRDTPVDRGPGTNATNDDNETIAEPAALRGSIYVYVRIPRSPLQISNFSIRIVAPDATTREGTVGNSPQQRLEGELGGPSTETSGQFRPEDPDGNSTYPFTVFENVSYNGTWKVYANRTRNSEIPTTNTSHENACAHFGFSHPNRKLRVFSGDEVYETPEALGSGRILFAYGGVFTTERDEDDTCAGSSR